MNIQAIYIRSHQERATPDKHVAYAVEVHTPNRTWTVWRRYSEFETLLKDIEGELAGAVASASEKGKGKETWASSKLPELPPKRASLGSAIITPWRGLTGKGDEQFIKERQNGLETFLRGILGSREAYGQAARESRAFKAFLEMPVATSLGGLSGKLASGGSVFTSQSWIEEYHALENVCKDVQSAISRRDSLAERGDSTASHQSNVQAKKQLAGLVHRLTALAASLDGTGFKSALSDGELRRRTDMVAKLQDRAEVLGKLTVATAAAAESRRQHAQSQQQQSTNATRQDLFSNGQAGSKPVTRVLGARKPAEETAQTRALDNGGLMQLQLQEMDDQDDRLASLTSVLRRQRQLATAINVELAEQNETLDQFSGEVDATGAKLTNAKKQMKKLGS